MSNPLAQRLLVSHAQPRVMCAGRPERRDEFLEVIRGNEHGTLTTEPLSKAYIWGEDVSTPNLFHFHEEYTSHAGFVAHTKTPHFKVWEDFVATDPFTSEVVVSQFVPMSAADA